MEDLQEDPLCVALFGYLLGVSWSVEYDLLSVLSYCTFFLDCVHDRIVFLLGTCHSVAFLVLFSVYSMFRFSCMFPALHKT